MIEQHLKILLKAEKICIEKFHLIQPNVLILRGVLTINLQDSARFYRVFRTRTAYDLDIIFIINFVCFNVWYTIKRKFITSVKNTKFITNNIENLVMDNKREREIKKKV